MVEKEKDIVWRLRDAFTLIPAPRPFSIPILEEAADEIERLRGKLKQAEDFIRSDVPCVITTTEERAALGQARGGEETYPTDFSGNPIRPKGL